MRGILGLRVVLGVAGLAVAVIVVAAIAVALQPDDDPPSAAPDTPEALLERVQAALSRPGEVAHVTATIDLVASGEEQRFGELDVWYDDSGVAHMEWELDPGVQSDSAPHERYLLDNDYVYAFDPEGDDDASRYFRTESLLCYAGAPAVLTVAPLMCAFLGWTVEDPVDSWYEGSRDFDGRRVLSIAYQSRSSAAEADKGIHRFLVDPDTFLPVAYVVEYDDPRRGSMEAVYDVEFVPRDSLGDGFFDAYALGYRTAGKRDLEALDDPDLPVPIYWPGREFTVPGYEASLEGVTRTGGPQPGMVLMMSYQQPGGGEFHLDYWPIGAWERFQDYLGPNTQFGECAQRVPVDGGPGEITIIQSWERPDMRPPTPIPGAGPPTPQPTRLPSLFPDGCPTTEPDRFMAEIRFPEVVVTINAFHGRFEDRGEQYGVFDTKDGLLAIARALAPRNPGE